MSSNIYKTVYLSLAIPLTEELQAVQQQVCYRYGLIPRSEIHLTIAFFGEMTANKLVKLASLLVDDLPSYAISQLRVNGLGGAYQVAENLILIQEEEPDELQQFPRVFWLAVDVIEQLYSFRLRVKQTAEALGINTTSIGSKYFPHLTIGSAGPYGQGHWKLWDVHTVSKGATIDLPIPLENLQAYKLHLTDVSIHPDSVHLLYLFPTKTITV